MPPGEEMFQYHGYSGNCPKPSKLPPYQQRVVEEKTQLDERIKKLEAFCGSEEHSKLSSETINVLARQRRAMLEYSLILHERIAMFERINPPQSELAK
jgi:hypothetical protein